MRPTLRPTDRAGGPRAGGWEVIMVVSFPHSPFFPFLIFKLCTVTHFNTSLHCTILEVALASQFCQRPRFITYCGAWLGTM